MGSKQFSEVLSHSRSPNFWMGGALWFNEAMGASPRRLSRALRVGQLSSSHFLSGFLCQDMTQYLVIREEPREEKRLSWDLARTLRSSAVLALQPCSCRNESLRDLLRPRYRRLLCGRGAGAGLSG